MSLEIAQFNTEFRKQDRRQNSVFIEHERRSGIDRRENSIFSKLKEDVDRFDIKSKDAQQAVLYALSPIPTARRISSLPDTLEENNWSRAGLLLGMAAANSPGDFREMALAGRELKNIYSKGFSAIEYKGQHSSTFLKNTFLHCLSEKIPILKNLDKSLFDTKFGEFIQKIFKIQIDPNSLISNDQFFMNGKVVSRFKFLGNSASKLMGRTLLRIPVLGLVASAILEVPALVNSTKKEGNIFDKAKSFAKQLCKSAGYVGFVNTGIALAGAALMPYGYIAALIGMGVGGSLGLFASKKLNNFMNKPTV